MPSFENEEDRTSFSKYYTPSVEIKEFNVLIDGKSFFGVPIKNKKERYKNVIEMSKNNDYTTGNLLDFFQIINFIKKINFIGKLEEKNGPTMFFIIEKSEETTFNFSQNVVSVK